MKLIQLTQGYVARVSDQDFKRVSKFKWCAVVYLFPDGTVRNIYAVNGSDNRAGGRRRLHRFILGVIDPKIEVDHRDGDGLNCQRRNLRRSAHKQNLRNMRKHRDGRSSQYKGVSWRKREEKWQAKIMVSGRAIFLGSFASEKDAAVRYDVAARKYHGGFAALNFPRAGERSAL